MREPPYLDGTQFDAEDFAAAQAPPPAVDPSDEGVVWVNWVSKDEDLWTASWERRTEHTGATGTGAEILRWALDRSASQRWIYDSSVGDYVPLTRRRQRRGVGQDGEP
jgi:hypothetical protein